MAFAGITIARDRISSKPNFGSIEEAVIEGVRKEVYGVWGMESERYQSSEVTAAAQLGTVCSKPGEFGSTALMEVGVIVDGEDLPNIDDGWLETESGLCVPSEAAADELKLEVKDRLSSAVGSLGMSWETRHNQAQSDMLSLALASTRALWYPENGWGAEIESRTIEADRVGVMVTGLGGNDLAAWSSEPIKVINS
mgnify:CR=1 FL=1